MRASVAFICRVIAPCSKASSCGPQPARPICDKTKSALIACGWLSFHSKELLPRISEIFKSGNDSAASDTVSTPCSFPPASSVAVRSAITWPGSAVVSKLMAISFLSDGPCLTSPFKLTVKSPNEVCRSTFASSSDTCGSLLFSVSPSFPISFCNDPRGGFFPVRSSNNCRPLISTVCSSPSNKPGSVHVAFILPARNSFAAPSESLRNSSSFSETSSTVTEFIGTPSRVNCPISRLSISGTRNKYRPSPARNNSPASSFKKVGAYLPIDSNYRGEKRLFSV